MGELHLLSAVVGGLFFNNSSPVIFHSTTSYIKICCPGQWPANKAWWTSLWLWGDSANPPSTQQTNYLGSKISESFYRADAWWSKHLSSFPALLSLILPWNFIHNSTLNYTLEIASTTGLNKWRSTSLIAIFNLRGKIHCVGFISGFS